MPPLTQRPWHRSRATPTSSLLPATSSRRRLRPPRSFAVPSWDVHCSAEMSCRTEVCAELAPRLARTKCPPTCSCTRLQHFVRESRRLRLQGPIANRESAYYRRPPRVSCDFGTKNCPYWPLFTLIHLALLWASFRSTA